MTNRPDTAAFFDDVQAAESRDAVWAPLAPLNQALHLLLGPALGPLPEQAHILLVGVGTGPELLALAAHNPSWRFTALDPAEAMLTICRRRADEAQISGRCTFHHGTVDSLPADAVFDAATAITVSHFFVDPAARTQFFADIATRLKANAPFINADLATGCQPHQQEQLLKMWAALMQHRMPADFVETILGSLKDKVALSSRDSVDRLMGRAGFTPATQIFQTLLLHAWQCRRQP